MRIHRRQHQHSRHRLGGLHETAVIERDFDLIRLEMGEKGLLARDVPPTISGAVGQDGEIAVRAVGLIPAGRDIRQLLCGKRSDLVENITLREFTRIEKSGDSIRDPGSESDRKQGERHCLVHDMFKRSVVVVVSPSAIYLIEVVYDERFIETAWLGVFDEHFSRPVDDGLHRRDRRRSAACLEAADCRVSRHQELAWADLEKFSQGVLRCSV